jgi:hypothetical protein
MTIELPADLRAKLNAIFGCTHVEPWCQNGEHYRGDSCPAVVRPAVEALLAEERATAEKRRQQRDIFRRLWEDTREGEQRFEAERDTLRRELAEARAALAAIEKMIVDEGYYTNTIEERIVWAIRALTPKGAIDGE